jgi:hypothetical protein
MVCSKETDLLSKKSINMTRQYSFILVIMMAVVNLAMAQGVPDAVRWSVFAPGGTARTLGVGGAFGAMGGDFSVININPAGIAEYKRGEFTISPSVTSTNSDAYFFNNPTSASSYKASKFGLDNAAFVIARPKNGTWKSSNFTIGFSKIADLNNNFRLNAKSTGSITQRFIQEANGKILDDLDEFEAWPAFDAGAIYDPDKDLEYEADIFPDEAVEKSQIVNQKGAINEFSLGWAGNYENKLNVGVSMGIPLVSFEEFKQYEEDDPLDEIPFFNNLQFNEFLNTTGYGVNFKVGFIYNLQKYLRIGGALHSPTWYTLNDDYFTDLSYSYYDNGIQDLNHRSKDGSFKYKLNTPWKAVGSIGSIYSLGKVKGFVNADVEWVDYSSNKFDFAKYSTDPGELGYTFDVNNEISQVLGSALNLRLGTELALGKLRLRVGTERANSPYVDQEARITTNSFGFGFRENNFFLDFGFQKRSFKDSYLPYYLNDASQNPIANVESSKNRVVVTAGFKF